MSSALWWLSLNILSIVILSFYSMMEMACVSFNKVRLQYYLSKGQKRAIWLNFLLHNPARLFGTTLIGVNVALMVGSECAREFHIAIGVNPDLAPLSQVFIVLIFGELAPMFAARHYTEHVAMMGVPLVYASAKVMAPIIWVLGLISNFVNRLVGGQEASSNIFISRDELQKILEVQEEEHPTGIGKKEEFNVVVSNIFNLREKDASLIMESLESVQMLPANSPVLQYRKVVLTTNQPYIPLYHQIRENIVGIVTPREVIKAPDHKRLRDFAKSPWFITKEAKVLALLKQFRSNRQKMAIVLDDKGKAIGIVTLDDILEEVFGKTIISKEGVRKKKMFLIERSFPGDLKVSDFNKQFDANLPIEEGETLADLIVNRLGHNPEVGDSVYIEPFELIVKETTLLEVKTVIIKSRVI